MRVKICGITRLEDARSAIKYGADALGFVFYEKSPRYISPKDAKELIAKLPPFVEKVGLFVEESAKNIDEICSFCGATLAQIHFDADSSLYSSLKTKHVKVVRAEQQEDVLRFADEYRLVDAYVPSFCGEGKRLNLDWFKDTDNSKTILAGGLNTDNIDELKGFGFYGVDVSSGVETTKGIKDEQKIKEFLQKAKRFSF